MDKNHIKVVAFDLGYTLVYNTREQQYMNYLQAKKSEASVEEVTRAYHLTDKTFMRHYQGMLGHPPHYFLPWYLGLVNHQLGKRFDLIEQTNYFLEQTDRSSYWQCFPWSRQVLESLKDKGYKIALLSNWDSSCRELLKELELHDYFDHILISSEVGIEKPEQRIFQLLLEQSGCQPEEIIYVGDNYYDDVIGSRKAGIETILINRFDNIGIEEINDCRIIGSTQELLALLS